jgi:hypothetical protein
MTNDHSVGGYIDAWCTKCKLELGHIIVAMVDDLPKKVKCNTCQGQHNYKAKPAERSRTKAAGTAKKRKAKESTYETYLALLKESDVANVKKYGMKDNFEKDQVIDHSRFGTGIVTAVINPNKIEILFKDGTKLLGQNL